jgi:sulfonate transport system substrate-binding protein
LADEANISLVVAKRQLARTGFDESIPGQSHRAALKAAAPILIAEGLVKPGTDVAKVIDDLVTEAPATKVALRFPHGTTR